MPNITPEQVGILESVLGKCTKTKQSSELVFHCPFHDRKTQTNPDAKKLAIHVSGKWHCWHCHKRGLSPVPILLRLHANSAIEKFKSFSSYLYDYVVDGDIDTFISTDPYIVLPDGFQLLMYKSNDPEIVAAKNYLKLRGITKEDIIFYKLGYCNSGRFRDRIVFTSFDENGFLNYYSGRKIFDDPGSSKYINCSNASPQEIIFNELYVDWDSNVCLVEGPIDAIKCKNSIPILGSSVGGKSKLFSTIVQKQPNIVVALDRDAFNKSIKICDLLVDYGINVRMVDLRKSKYKDVGEMTKNVADECIKNAPKYDKLRLSLA